MIATLAMFASSSVNAAGSREINFISAVIAASKAAGNSRQVAAYYGDLMKWASAVAGGNALRADDTDVHAVLFKPASALQDSVESPELMGLPYHWPSPIRMSQSN